MKKLALFLAALMCLLSFAACGSDTPDTTTAPSGNNAGDSTTQPTTPPGPAISDDWSDFEFVLDGVKYRLPCTVQSFLDNGWAFQEDISGTSLEYDKVNFFVLTKGTEKIDIEIRNLSNQGAAIAVTEGSICGIEVYSSTGASMRVAKAIAFGSSAADVTNAFGFPDSYTYSDIGDETETYDYNEHGTSFAYGFNTASFGCTKTGDTYLLTRIKLTCFEAIDSVPVEVSEEAPAFLSTYKAPTELGTNPTSGVISVGGDLYQLPCPVSAFLDNGWVVSSHSGPLGSNDTSLYYVRRNGVKLCLWIGNMAEETVLPHNAVVHRITANVDDYDTYGDWGVTLPGDITVGMTQDALLSVLTPLEEVFVTGDSSYGISYTYEIYIYGFEVEVIVDTQTNTVYEITLGNETWMYE